MRQFLLLIGVLFISISANAQIISGDKLTGNIVATDINGNKVDIYADLAAGKTVVLDIFATWCGPCWSYHNSGYLKEVNKVFGPKGSDQVRIYAIEGDGTTSLDLISQAANGGTAATTSLGDWTEGVEYGIINDHTFNNILKIAFFPTLYVIRPDKTVMEMGDFRTNSQVWVKALVPTAAKDVIFTSGIDSKSFCSTGIFNAKPNVINMGTTAISSVDTELSLNGVSTPFTANTPLGVFQSGTLSFGTKTVTETTEFKITVESVDGVVDEPDDLSSITTNFYKPVVEGTKMTVKFTTDFYPAETSWVLKDNKNRTLASGTYEPGTEDDFGGGGVDANTEHVYDVTIANTTDVNCLTITLTDSYGDGMTAFNSTHPFPGVEFYNAKGDLIKPKLTSEFNFQSANPGTTPSTTKSFASFSLGSSLEDQSFVESLNVYPNPVTDILNIDMKINAETEYEVFVTNMMGAAVTKISQNTNFLNVGNLTSGMYFLNVRTKDGLFTHKFTKI